ncbi:hypothetical protein PCE1_003720 [Barthelona sp. PCE]
MRLVYLPIILLFVLFVGIFVWQMKGLRESAFGRMFFSVRYLIPAPLRKRLVNFADYAANKPNHLFQGFYVLLVGGIYISYMWKGREYVDPLQDLVFQIMYVICWIWFIICCNSDPGTVDRKTVASYLQIYEPDFALYMFKSCETCKILRPARSRHCRLCDKCYARHDHHCVWFNNCFGHNNYRYFLYFLVHHSLILMYLCFITYRSLNVPGLMASIIKRGVPPERVTWARTMLVMLNYRTFNLALSLFAASIGAVVFIFFLYHLYLVGRNTPTMETGKIAEKKELMAILTKFVMLVKEQKMKIKKKRQNEITRELGKLYKEYPFLKEKCMRSKNAKNFKGERYLMNDLFEQRRRYLEICGCAQCYCKVLMEAYDKNKFRSYSKGFWKNVWSVLNPAPVTVAEESVPELVEEANGETPEQIQDVSPQ